MTKARQDKQNSGRKAVPRTRKPFDTETAKAMYQAGTHKIRDLAAWSGYCYGTVRRRLLEAGVELDKPGGNRRKRKNPENATASPQVPQEGDAG